MIARYISSGRFSQALALIGAAAVSGCFGTSVRPYPAVWPPLAIDATNPCRLAGRYAVLPRHAPESPETPSSGKETDSAWGPLVDVVDPGIEGFPYIRHTSLLIVHGQDELGAFIDVSAEDAGTIVATKRLREGVHFTCTQAGLEITRDWHFININVGPALEKYRHVFHKDPQDGALVLHNLVQDRALVLFIIPVWGGDETWMRWRALKSPDVKEASG